MAHSSALPFLALLTIYTMVLQTGEAYLTDMRREVQQKSQLLESSLSLVKSLEGSDTTTPTLPTPDPVRVHVHFMVITSLIPRPHPSWPENEAKLSLSFVLCRL